MRALCKHLGVLFLVIGISLSTGHTPLPASNPIQRKVAVVFLKHTPPFFFTQADLQPACEPSFPPDIVDTVSQPRHTAAQYGSLLNTALKNYFRSVTFEQVILSFEAISNPDSADGWFEAPHKLYQYNQNAASLVHTSEALCNRHTDECR